MIKFKVGPQEETLEFLVDTGAEHTCVTQIPKGCEESSETIKVLGAKGEGFKAPVIRNVTVESKTRIGVGDLLIVPGAGCNLLGRDLQLQLEIGVVPEEGQMKVRILQLTPEDEAQIKPEVWATKDNRGGINIDPITVNIEHPEYPIRLCQYPISKEGREGLKPVIDGLIQNGTLEPCMSPHNTPILLVRKGDGSYRLVQDLREVNKKTLTRFPVVSNPYTLLSHIPPTQQWYRIIDLKDTFWACPLAEESRDIFACWELA